MSVPYQKELLATNSLKLIVNASGINKENTANTEDFSINIFAFSKSDYKQLFSEELNFQQAKNLFDYLNSFSILRGDSIETGRFIEVTSDASSVLAAISKVDSNLVKQLLNKADDDNKLNLIIEALSVVELQTLHASIRQTAHKLALANLSHLLALEKADGNITTTVRNHENLSDYVTGQPEKIFQNWIEKNIWTLGIDYINKHSARQISIDSESDLIMESTDGYIDLIELKRPKMNLLSYDPSHKSYYPSPDLSKVIGQCLLYLKALDDYKAILEKKHKFKLLKPRIKIIGGRSDEFSDDQHDALRMINSALNGMQVISYDYLHACGQNIVSYYDKQVSVAIETNQTMPSIS